MSLLEQTLAVIEPANQEIPHDAAKRINQIMEDDDLCLGGLRDLLLRYLAITGKRRPQAPENARSFSVPITA